MKRNIFAWFFLAAVVIVLGFSSVAVAAEDGGAACCNAAVSADAETWNTNGNPIQLASMMDVLKKVGEAGKTKKCPSCNGKKTLKQWDSCTSCGGKGQVICPECRGNPLNPDGTVRQKKCKTCGWKGTVKCTACKGKGGKNVTVDCWQCNGTGKVPS